MPDQALTPGAQTIAEVEAGFTGLAPGDDAAFERYAALVADFQRTHNPVYRRYAEALPEWRWPLLPVEAFKQASVTCCGSAEPELLFRSSGTGQGTPAHHPVCRAAVYERAFLGHFEALFGPGPHTLLAHLPHYSGMGRQSSLLYMVQGLVDRFGDARSGFFLEDDALLRQALAHQGTGRLILFGAAFGLLDLLDRGQYRLPDNALVLETGGMKTFRRDITRVDLHDRLADGFGVERERVWSEYGMCELLSQCYTRGGTTFYPPPWMRVFIVDPADPMVPLPAGREGALAVIDLANLYSASFLLTQDRAVADGAGFQVLGRLAGADLRGCNFLLEQIR